MTNGTKNLTLAIQPFTKEGEKSIDYRDGTLSDQFLNW